MTDVGRERNYSAAEASVHGDGHGSTQKHTPQRASSGNTAVVDPCRAAASTTVQRQLLGKGQQRTMAVQNIRDSEFLSLLRPREADG